MRVQEFAQTHYNNNVEIIQNSVDIIMNGKILTILLTRSFLINVNAAACTLWKCNLETLQMMKLLSNIHD